MRIIRALGVRRWRRCWRSAAGPAAAQGTEGEVVVYTAAQSTIVQAIGPMFEKKTGIKVSFVEARHRRDPEAGARGGGEPARGRPLGARRGGHGGQRRPPRALHGGRRRQDRRHLQEGHGRRPDHAEQRDADGHRLQHEAPAGRRGAEDAGGASPKPAGRTRSPTRRPTSRGRRTRSWRPSSPCSATTTPAGRSSRTS